MVLVSATDRVRTGCRLVVQWSIAVKSPQPSFYAGSDLVSLGSDDVICDHELAGRVC